MIAYLRGKLLFKKANKVMVDVAGVGYEVCIPVSTFYDLGDVGSEVSLHVYTHVREDIFALYGFRTEGEKGLFERFLSVSGVGPKMAVAILSGLEMDELIPALRKGNLALLTHIPGVGRKTAERLVLELREKLDDLAVAADEKAAARAPASEMIGVEADVFSALVNLGYARPAAAAAVREVLNENPEADFDALLRSSLRMLARKFFSAREPKS